MKLATATLDGREVAVLVDQRGVIEVDRVVDGHYGSALEALSAFSAPELAERLAQVSDARLRPVEQVDFIAPYRRPHKVWGIGLNYVEHAADLNAPKPTSPASFIKGDHTIIGPGEEIPLPRQSRRVTAEAELGLVIGRLCREVEPERALEYVWVWCRCWTRPPRTSWPRIRVF